MMKATTCFDANLRAFDPGFPLEEAAISRFEAFQAGGGGKVLREARSVQNLDVAMSAEGNLVLSVAGKGEIEAVPTVLELPENWEGLGVLEMDASATGNVRVTLAAVGARCWLGEEVRMGKADTVRLSLDDFPLAAGNQPLYRASAIRLHVMGEGRLTVHRIRMLPREGPPPPVVDAFGQRRSQSWPGKVLSEEDLEASRVREEETFTRCPSFPGRSRFGGWTEGPRFEATGFFRTENQSGRWWLVDPEGHPFWSIGTTGVRVCMHNDATRTTAPPFPMREEPDDVTTSVANRDFLFAQLPRKAGDEGKTWVEEDGVSFYTWNVLRKYGSFENWRDHVVRRFRSLGFTTFGNWSAAIMLDQTEISHTRTLRTTGPGAPLATHRFADVFSTEWQEWFDRACANEASPHRENPWLLGYFIDNEQSWHNARFVDAAADTATKRAFVEYLRLRFQGRIETMNTDWGTSFRDWAAVARSKSEDFPSVAESVLRGFDDVYAEEYFRQVRRILKRHDPNHLYLGCRFVRRHPADGIMQAAGRYCDVLTVNCYSMLPDRAEFQKWHDESGRPVLIGEHHLPLATPRQLPPLYQAFRPAQRRIFYPEFVESFLQMPFSVGSHWFQHSDQPLTGRYSDGENQPVGFVDITDQPHPELAEAARDLAPRLYPMHASSA